MDLDEEVSGLRSTIIEVNASITPPVTADQNNPSTTSAKHKTVADPRLRSKRQTPLTKAEEPRAGEPPVAAMTADELMQKAREQMAALAQMEANNNNNTKGSPAVTGVTSQPVSAVTSEPANSDNSSNVNNKSQKIKIEWKKRK